MTMSGSVLQDPRAIIAGTAIGIGVPWLHGNRYSPSGTEVGAGGTGLLLGAAAPLLFPVDRVPEDISLSFGVPGAPGLSLSGQF